MYLTTPIHHSTDSINEKVPNMYYIVKICGKKCKTRSSLFFLKWELYKNYFLIGCTNSENEFRFLYSSLKPQYV